MTKVTIMGGAVYALVGSLTLYGMMVAGLYMLQDSMIFPRAAAAVPVHPRPAGAIGLDFVAAHKHRVFGNLVPAGKASRGLLIGFGGNAWNADDLTSFLARRLSDIDIAAFHYRGYAPSEGEPSEAALFEDALHIYDILVESRRPAKIVVAGFSLGSGVAAYLAAHRPLDGTHPRHPFRLDRGDRCLTLPMGTGEAPSAASLS